MPPGRGDAGSFARRVQQWQSAHGRDDLPWLGLRDPYRVWLSEIMLQQTQVATVRRYYERFVQRMPTLPDLAAASLDEVLSLWSGLGYYARARQLHRAAREVVLRHGGRLPQTAAELARLPGIGRSTAAAIAAFCHGERAAILDGNVRRVLARWSGFDGDAASAAGRRHLWSLADSLLPDSGIERYTQGLMDIGAGVCTPRAPDCGRCPVADDCAARAHGQPEAFPRRSARTSRGRRFSAWLWIVRGSHHWLVPRPAQGIWGGLWSLPEFDHPDRAIEALGGLPGRAVPLAPTVHALTHLDWTLQPLQWRLPQRGRTAADERLAALWPGGRWLTLDQALELGLPAPWRKLFESAGA